MGQAVLDMDNVLMAASIKYKSLKKWLSVECQRRGGSHVVGWDRVFANCEAAEQMVDKATHSSNCSICMCPLDLAEPAVGLPSACSISTTSCGHSFHAQCLALWLSRGSNNRCPLCRVPLVASETPVASLQGDLDAEYSSFFWSTLLPSSLGNANRCFEARLRSLEAKYCKAYERAERLAGKHRGRLSHILERRLLGARTRQLYAEALVLRRFSSLNARAARKIAKKADKLLGTVNRQQVQQVLDNSLMVRACRAATDEEARSDERVGKLTVQEALLRKLFSIVCSTPYGEATPELLLNLFSIKPLLRYSFEQRALIVASASRAKLSHPLPADHEVLAAAQRKVRARRGQLLLREAVYSENALMFHPQNPHKAYFEAKYASAATNANRPRSGSWGPLTTSLASADSVVELQSHEV